MGASAHPVVVRGMGRALSEGPGAQEATVRLLKVPAKGSFSTKGQSGEAQGASYCHGKMHSPFPPTSSNDDQHLPKKPKVPRESVGLQGKAITQGSRRKSGIPRMCKFK